ncbi:MAG: pyridoxamine 5'-phosphate oxidase family protein [Methanomicrobiales archaeon]|nr:pyridoxamine 5'-phosphate oxidase family protein [Methanomicrobiales archaeon]MDI6875781.1 pyridoxamine 5'-phosphate oxidase family protein [Methanomicrobiales archaeon]
MASKLMDYFNKQPRIGTLSTASRDGKVDSAVFGSPRMVDERTVVMGLGKNRTLANLQENPRAVFLIMEPGQGIADWKGVRVYLTAREIATSGPSLDALRSNLAKAIGDQAARMIQAAVTFEVTEVRPLIDMGQGWEQSI